jgi:hypothetical protein
VALLEAEGRLQQQQGWQTLAEQGTNLQGSAQTIHQRSLWGAGWGGLMHVALRARLQGGETAERTSGWVPTPFSRGGADRCHAQV